MPGLLKSAVCCFIGFIVLWLCLPARQHNENKYTCSLPVEEMMLTTVASSNDTLNDAVGPYPIPPGEIEIGPGTKAYYTASKVQIPEAIENAGIQCPVPKKDRIINTKGNCVWCSISLSSRYAGITKLYNISADVSKGGDRRCQGGSSPSPVRQFLEAEHIKYDMITNGDRSFLVKYCKEQRRMLSVGQPGHMLSMVHYDPDTKTIKIIDNADWSLSVQQVNWDKWHQRWDGWAVAVIGEPDLVPYKLNCWKKIPFLFPEDTNRFGRLGLEYFASPQEYYKYY